MGNSDVNLAAGNSLSGLGSGLVRDQVELIAIAHGADQSGSQESLRTGGAVGADHDLVAGLQVRLQGVDGGDAQLLAGAGDEDGGVQVLNVLEIVVGEVHAGRIEDRGDAEHALADEAHLRVSLGVLGQPAVDGGGVALLSVGNEDIVLAVGGGQGSGLLVDHRGDAGRSPRAGDGPGLGGQSGHAAQAEHERQNERDKLLHRNSLLIFQPDPSRAGLMHTRCAADTPLHPSARTICHLPLSIRMHFLLSGKFYLLHTYSFVYINISRLFRPVNTKKA